jgi:hypothetical protein
MTLSESDIYQLHNSLIESRKKAQTNEAQVSTKNEPVKVVSGIKSGDVISTGGAGSIKFTSPTTAELKNSEVKESGGDKKYNPWRICTGSVGRDDKEKYERCVQDVKNKNKKNLHSRNRKKIKEEKKDDLDVLLEEKIVYLLDKHIKPKMTKGNLLDLLESKKSKKPARKKLSKKINTNEDSDTKTAPSKPAPVKDPKTKPKAPPKPSIDPRKNPNPNPNEAPKAEALKKNIMMAIEKLLPNR